MAYTYQGDAILGVSLSVETPKPLDTRTVVDKTQDLYQVPANQAYRGMTISNLEDGNIYMLIDKNKITKSEGWKSSQSALQIISCTPEEYKEWAANTNENFEPIDKNKNYLLQSVYYYVYEAEGEQYYLSSDWGKDISDQLSKKASADALNNVLKKTNELAAKLADEYTTSEVIVETYATIALLNSIIDLEDPESPLSKALAPYYTSAQVDEKFVTKASLGGDLGDLGDGENLVFVTSKQYAEDQKNIQEELAKTLKLDGEGSLDSIVINQIKSPELEGKQLVLEVTPNGLLIEGNQVATESDIPVLINLSSIEYNALVEQDKINPDAYYCIYDEEDNKLVYVTLKDLESTYSTTTQTQFWVAQNYYTRQQIDDIVNTLQAGGDYVTGDQLEGYYTNTQVDAKFLSILEAANLYATKESLDNYVTKEMLKGSDTEDEDFMFVTSTQYAKDKETLQETINKTVKFNEDGSIEVPQIKYNNTFINIKEGGLYVGDEILANKSEVPVLITLTSQEYQQKVEANEIEEDAYYCIFDEENNKLVYITLQELEASYSTTTQTQFWTSQNFYTMSQIDEKLLNLQLGGNEATAELMKGYYTKLETDEKYLTIENAEANLATKDEVSALETKVSEEYVTITMLKGENTDDTDFMFVTQNQYSDDKEAASKKINTKEIETEKTTVSEVIIQKLEEKVVQQEGEDEGSDESIIEQNITSTSTLTSENNRLMSGGKQVALTEEIPQMICLPADEYQTLVKNDEVKEDVYYYTYNKEENPDDGYVTHAYVTSTFQTITKANQELHNTKVELEQKIAALELEIQSLRNLIMGSVEGQVLSIGIADNIEDKTLIVNSGKVENKTLILT